MSTEGRVAYESKAPVRVDLAGGTVDIWPIYLLIPDAVTTNLGVDLFAKTTVISDAKSTPQVTLRSVDQNVEKTYSWDQIEKLSAEIPPGLIIHARLLQFFMSEQKAERLFKPTALTLETHATSPAGAGLGGSSALGVSIIGALHAWCTGRTKLEPADRERFVNIMKDIESQVLKAPAGLQDYYGATYGGLQTMHWRAYRNERVGFDASILNGLHERLILFYSGVSRNSGINNWQVFKDTIDRYQPVVDKLTKIVHSTHALNRALSEKNWKSVAEAIESEWEERRTLAPGISTPEIDAAFKQARKLAKDASFKICGAGGGGCFFVFLPEPDASLKQKIVDAVTKNGPKHLPFKPVAEGLSVAKL